MAQTLGDRYGDEPKLADFGLDANVYENYKTEVATLQSRREYLEKGLQRLPTRFIRGTLILILYAALISVLVGLIKVNEGFALLIFLWLVFPDLIEELCDTAWVKNVLSGGKYKEAKARVQNVDKRLSDAEQSMKAQVADFETAARSYYEKRLEQMYRGTLYRKRSGSAQFEKALQDFSEAIAEVDAINQVLLTGVWLYQYKDYLAKRSVNHEPQETKERRIFRAFTGVTDGIPSPHERKEPEPPQSTYRTPRKIDWDAVNEKHKLTGMEGEEIVVAIEKAYLVSIDKPDLADRVQHVSVEQGDGLGYDVLSYFPDGSQKFIEVKTTTNSVGASFSISRNELLFLKENRATAFIYRLSLKGANEGTPPELIVKSADNILKSSEFVPIRYIVRAVATIS
jgi:truncated hemoglobin YjbI